MCPPIYDYRCENCGAEQEHIISVKELDDFKPNTDCCKKSKPKRFMPSKGVPTMKRGAGWRGAKGYW